MVGSEDKPRNGAKEVRRQQPSAPFRGRQEATRFHTACLLPSRLAAASLAYLYAHIQADCLAAQQASILASRDRLHVLPESRASKRAILNIPRLQKRDYPQLDRRQLGGSAQARHSGVPARSAPFAAEQPSCHSGFREPDLPPCSSPAADERRSVSPTPC
jgi:hypothetical protein